MRIIGIDPGYAIVGFGIVDYIGGKFTVLDYGAITTDKDTPFPQRLCEIYDDYCHILDTWKPDALSIERLYFTNNQKTGIDVAQARGIIMMAAQQRNIEINEYTPLQVKQAVVGYGQAVKKQVQEMTRKILKLKTIPKPDDTADALAMTICHGQSSGSLIRNLKTNI
ncbi:MAG: crossover junction endodeoxyribonuclease RuvC [Ruminiclostridium sp.]|nr:crossover junction endodeoxyribonuclease RuvC [Ruminiclostridium sp.]